MKAYIGKKSFSGVWSDKFNNCLRTYDSLSAMGNLASDEKLHALPIMLTRHMFDYFPENSHKSSRYDEAKVLLRRCYNNSDKKARVLMEWRRLRISKEMKNGTNHAEVEVFNDFIATLSNLQKHLDEDYQNDRYLRDRRLTSIATPSIRDPIWDRMPRTAQPIIQKTFRRLSNKPKSAGTLAPPVVGSKEDITGANEEGATGPN